MVRRERTERIAQTRLFARLIGNIFDIQPAKLEAQLDLYELEVRQDSYKPQVTAALRRIRLERARKRNNDLRLLKKLDKFTVK